MALIKIVAAQYHRDGAMTLYWEDLSTWIQSWPWKLLGFP